MRLFVPGLALLALPLAACNQNTALGNDREAQVEPAPTAAPQMAAEQALANVATTLIKPETMSRADIRAIGGLDCKCAIRFTEVSHPSLVYAPGEQAVIKLNAKLIALPSTDEATYADGGLSVTLQPNGEEGDAGLPGMNMLVVPPGAKDELGYSGFAECHTAQG